MRSGALKVILLVVAVLVGLYLLFNRALEFRLQAHRGQPIVRAIEEFKKQTGEYPTSLTDLVPKFLSFVPNTPDEANYKFEGWDYRKETNGAIVSYSLRYYMGRGGVEYEPPHWIGNEEGNRSILFSNE